MFVYIEFNSISTYFIGCVYLYGYMQMCLLRSVEDRKKVLGFNFVDLIIFNIGINFSKKDNFISYQMCFILHANSEME